MSVIRSRAIAFASSAAFALVLASSMASADGVDSDQDGVSDELENATERTVAASSSGDRFSLSSALGTGALQDLFELSYHPGTFDVWYGQRDGSSSSFSLELLNLLEWRDENGDGRIDEVEILQRTALGSSAFGGVPVERFSRSDPDGGRVVDFRVQSRTGDVVLNITVAQRFMRFGDVTLTPMEAKMQIRMNPAMSQLGTSVGLEFRMNTSQQVRFEDRSWDEQNGFAQSERAVNVTGGGGERPGSVFFSWGNTAIAAGLRTDVALSNSSFGLNSYSLYLAYPIAASQTSSLVVHQTALGVQSVLYDIVESTVPGRIPEVIPAVRWDLPLYAGTFAAVALLLALTVLLANRRRSKGEDETRKP
jgi:hypothetical protein